MNIQEDQFLIKQAAIRCSYLDPRFIHKMSRKILSWLPSKKRDLVILCIGTDRSTGDSLGPLTGKLLKEENLQLFSVHGTLHEPVHALNLQDAIHDVYNTYHKPYIIAVDACLGRSSSIGEIIASPGALQPGAALKKQLPPIGDMFLTGVVNIGGFMEYSVLQNTRLSLVIDMAKKLANLLTALDQQLALQKT